MIKGECTDRQLALNPLKGTVGVLWRECPLEFRREWGMREEEEAAMTAWWGEEGPCCK